jgi:lysozyme
MKGGGRAIIAGLVLSAVGLTYIASDEGYRDTAYNDGGGVQTVGFGTTTHPDGSPVKRGEKTDPVRALIALQGHVNKTEAAMRQCIGDVPLYQHEWDAFVGLAYNIGIGKSGVSDGFCYAKRGGYSGLVKALHQTPPDYAGACKQILRWNKDNGRVIPGLVARREREYVQCVGTKAPSPQPSPTRGEGVFSPSPQTSPTRGEGVKSPSPFMGEGWEGAIAPSPFMGEGWDGGVEDKGASS